MCGNCSAARKLQFSVLQRKIGIECKRGRLWQKTAAAGARTGGKFVDTPFSLKGVLLGCSTSATQIEGSPTRNSWYDWADMPGRMKDHSSPKNANQHWQRWREDNQLIQKLGLQVYRMGLEWSRIEPAPGYFCHKAMQHYRDEILDLRKKGVKVLVTLHHFSNPSWFEKEGGFVRKDSPQIFLRYVTYVVESIGDLVSDYVTLNEPNVYVTLSYFLALWPPAKHNPATSIRVMRNLVYCHLAAYRRIHRIREERHFPGRTMVSFTEHLRVFTPAHPQDHPLANGMEYLFQGLTMAMYTGRLLSPLGGGAPFGDSRFYDYIGINYYTRLWIDGKHIGVCPGKPVNDLGWEIYPEGLGFLMRKRYRRLCAPIWITENGIADREDKQRCRFLYDHLRQVADSGLPVERYYYWSLMDNFEWAEGETAAFGLIDCDFKTQKRTVRRSAYFYRDIIRNGGVTQQMIDTYLKE
jgi:beta-glucosidase